MRGVENECTCLSTPQDRRSIGMLCFCKKLILMSLYVIMMMKVTMVVYVMLQQVCRMDVMCRGRFSFGRKCCSALFSKYCMTPRPRIMKSFGSLRVVVFCVSCFDSNWTLSAQHWHHCGIAMDEFLREKSRIDDQMEFFQKWFDAHCQQSRYLELMPMLSCCLRTQMGITWGLASCLRKSGISTRTARGDVSKSPPLQFNITCDMPSFPLKMAGL